MKNKSFTQAASCLPLAILCNYASATDVLRLEGFGPISRAMGGTSMSYDVGNAGMMSNPAVLSLAKPGSHLSIGADVVYY